MKHYSRLKDNGTLETIIASPGEGRRWLLAHVDYSGEECLAWPFGKGARGYGSTSDNGRSIAAHLLMCRLAHGPKPGKRYVAAHSCGKGHEACVNPRHLRWDTVKGNHADMVLHGTHNRGENSPTNKLTENDVRKILSLIGTKPMKEIGKDFGVSYTLIFNIKHGINWGWLK
jgi:hypothetical protein